MSEGIDWVLVLGEIVQMPGRQQRRNVKPGQPIRSRG
jgi:hypothetical protein